jgi:proline iminopeptidase
MRISLGNVSLFDVSGPSVVPQGDTTAERPVLVAVHRGPGLDHMTVKSALAPLAEDFQVLYFDLRGHGRLANTNTPTRAQTARPSSTASATRFTAPRPAGPRNRASSWPG